MSGRDTVLGPPARCTGDVRVAAAGPAAMTEPAGTDPTAATGTGVALRVPAFVFVTSALSLGAHAAAGGGPPSPRVTILIGVLLGIAGRLFALRERSLPRLSYFRGLPSGVHHPCLARPAGSPSSSNPLALPSSDLTAAANPASQATRAVTVTTGHHGTPRRMLFLHAVVRLMVAAWLRRSEAAAFCAARRISPRLLPRLTILPIRAQRIPTLAVCPTVRRPATRQYICRATPRRGPPSPVLA
jgi:hypothetical protein